MAQIKLTRTEYKNLQVGDLAIAQHAESGLSPVTAIQVRTIPAHVEFGGYRSNQARRLFVATLQDGTTHQGESQDLITLGN